MVQDVFGKHTDMFDEFKMILNARGATDSVQNDLWYSMPLSEIDFSQVWAVSCVFVSLRREGVWARCAHQSIHPPTHPCHPHNLSPIQ